MSGEWVLYLYTLLHLDPAVFVIIHHLMDAPQGLQAVAVCLAHTWWWHHRAEVYMDQESNGIILSIILLNVSLEQLFTYSLMQLSLN